MEMEVATSRGATKRTYEALEADELPPPATAGTDEPDPQPATKKSNTHSEETPPSDAEGEGGGDSGGDVDYISGLPDAILGEIVSLLSTKDAARTQTLASRWRHIWSAAALNLDGLPSDDEAFVGAVSRILSIHPGPCRRFCIPTHHLRDRPATVDAWLQSPALDNLQELVFWEDGFNWERRRAPPAPPPASAFRFSASLSIASFSKCHLLDVTVQALHFPLLRQLGLEHSLISEGSLNTMISSCPVLECLLINYCSGFRCVQIQSNSLRNLGVGAEICQIRDLIVVDAPSLERLLLLPGCEHIDVSIIAAPKLETLGYLDVFNMTLMFGSRTILQGLHVVSPTTVVDSVKILSIRTDGIHLDRVIILMKWFPCLEELYIESNSGPLNQWRRKHKHFIRSFDIRLKIIEIKWYRGIRSQVNFASFFLLNARQLELMRLVVSKNCYNAAFVAQQHKMLQVEKRASRDGRLDITPRTSRGYHSEIKHVRDLCMANPFECNC